MSTRESKSNRKSALLLCLGSVVLAVPLVYVGYTNGWSKFTISAIIVLILTAAACLLFAFVRISKGEIPISRRRFGVIVNYLSLIGLLACFYWVEARDYRGFGDMTVTDAVLLVGGLIGLVMITFSFIDTHVRTRLWELTHTRLENLDERQVLVVHEALRRAYGTFAVLCLSTLVVAELIRDHSAAGIDTPLMPVVAALIYLVHTLPGALLAWTEKEV